MVIISEVEVGSAADVVNWSYEREVAVQDYSQHLDL